MIALHVGNSMCRITGLSDIDFRALREEMSYSVDAQARYFSGSPHAKRYLLGKRGDFPSGLCYLVDAFLDKHRLAHTIQDARIRPTKPLGAPIVLPLGPTPYRAQIEAVEAAQSVDGGILSLPTGSGKSYTMAMLISALGLRTLVVVPNLTLRQQLRDNFKTFLGDTGMVRVENIDSTVLATLTDYDVLMLDEAHHAAASTYRRLNRTAWKGIYYRFCFTATEYRNREEEQLLMESVTGPVIYKLTYKDAVDAGMVVPVEAYYVELPNMATAGWTWAEVYSDLVTLNQHRNGVIARILQLLHAAKKSTLCLVKEIAHGNRIVELTGGAFATGVDGNSQELVEWFNSQKITVLTGTTGVLGEGVDTRPCEYVVIAGLGKSKPAFLQQVGRAVRRYPGKESAKVILFKDYSHKFTKNHFLAQCRHLKDYYGVSLTKLEVV